MSANTAENITFEKIDEDQSWAIFSAAAQRELSISGEDFVDQWDSGEFSDDDSPGVMRVAMLRPSGR